MITNYLIELIKDNECVIVPEFGAFISKRHSAAIDYANHRFTPPYKEIVFNNKLKNDDGLLVAFLTEKENITKDEAVAKIQSFVNQSEAILDVNAELSLEGLGKIRKFGDDYVLSLKTEENLLGDSFGLTEFNMQPVFRTETYQIIKEKIVAEQKEKTTDYTVAIESIEEHPDATTRRKPGLAKTFALTTLAFLLLFVLNWKTEQSDSNLASWNPFLYSSPNEFLINIIDTESIIETENVENVMSDKIVETENLVTVATEPVIETVTVETVEVEKMESQSTEEMKPHHYFIVGGSFQTLERANVCLDEIRNKGFENAAILEKNDKGYIRVYYESFAEKPEALIRLEAIKTDFNESAWLLFQK